MKLRKLIIFYLVLGIAISIEIIADIFLKKSGASDLKFIILGMLLYGSTAIPVAFLFKKTDFELLFLIWEAFGVLLGLVVATYYFGETFTLNKTLALVFSMGALVTSYL